MKEPNVLEAIDLCVNGNPCTERREEFNGMFGPSLMELVNAMRDIAMYAGCNPFKKGSHETLPIGEGPEPIIMPDGKEVLVTNQPITFKELKEVDINKKYGIKDDDLIMPDFFKGSLPIFMAKKKSWFDDFKKWLKYWFTPREEVLPSPIVSDAFHENQRRYTERMNTIDNAYVGFSREKQNDIDRIKRVQKLSCALKQATRNSELLGKALNRMRRRKKRYSISTPMKRAWK